MHRLIVASAYYSREKTVGTLLSVENQRHISKQREGDGGRERGREGGERERTVNREGGCA